ncbi:deoxynucleoside kinase [Fructilactobacillus florum]|nr:deoxynucleoside kinase [Fructilactobacillus florum]
MLVLAGPIGAGKTSLTTILAQHLQAPAFYESVDDNEILPLFYENPRKYAFLLQIYFLNKRLASLRAATANPLSVMDRSIFEDSLLFHLNADLGRATATEVETYDELLANMLDQVGENDFQKIPDLLIYVRVSFQTMLEHIQRRGRVFEQLDNDASLYEYYQELNQRYASWYANYKLSPKIQIDGDQFDFVNNPADQEVVLATLDAKIKQIMALD